MVRKSVHKTERKSDRKSSSDRDPYPVEKGVPIPESRGQHGKYPWSKLRPGDSFFVAGQTSQTFGTARQYAATRHGITLISRTVTERGKSGVRVWRTK